MSRVSAAEKAGRIASQMYRNDAMVVSGMISSYRTMNTLLNTTPEEEQEHNYTKPHLSAEANAAHKTPFPYCVAVKIYADVWTLRG